MKKISDSALEIYARLERRINHLRYGVVVAGGLLLATSPFFGTMTHVLPSPTLRQSCLYFLLLLSVYLIYASFSYRKLSYLRQHYRLEQRFLHHHQDDMVMLQTLTQEQSTWASSKTFRFFQRMIKPETALTENKRIWRFSRHVEPHALLPEEHFDETIGTLGLPWLSLAPAILLSMGWIILQTPARIHPVLWEQYHKGYTLAQLAWVAGVVLELTLVVQRYGLYRQLLTLREHLISGGTQLQRFFPKENQWPDWNTATASSEKPAPIDVPMRKIEPKTEPQTLVKILPVPEGVPDVQALVSNLPAQSSDGMASVNEIPGLELYPEEEALQATKHDPPTLRDALSLTVHPEPPTGEFEPVNPFNHHAVSDALPAWGEIGRLATPASWDSLQHYIPSASGDSLGMPSASSGDGQAKRAASGDEKVPVFSALMDFVQ